MKNKISRASFSYLLSNYAVPLRKSIMFLVCISFAASFIIATQPVVFAGIMNIVIGNDIAVSAQKSAKLLDLNQIGNRVLMFVAGYSHDKWGCLLFLAAVFILLTIAASVLNYSTYLLSLKIELQAMKLIQTDLLNHLLSLNINFFNHQKTGDLMSRVIHDVRNTANGLGPLLASLLNNAVVIVIYSTYLFSTNALLTIVAFFLILTQFGLTQIIRRPIGRTIRCSLDALANFSNMLHEVFTSVRIMKSFGGEEYEMEKLGQGIDNVAKAETKAGMIRHLQEPTRSILDSFAMVGIVLIAAQQLMKGSLSIQGFALFIFVGQLLVTPINKLAVTFSWLQALLVSYGRVNELLNTRPQVVDGNVVKEDFIRDIEIKNVSFSYGSGFVLENISFEVKKGEIVAIVGPSGAGKSTLVDLIMRFYDPSKGGVSIDGVDLREIKYDKYRKVFGVVPQQNILFNDTIKNNILYGRFYLSDSDVIRAAQVANAHKFIMEFPKGYDTIVGERGLLLSGGQCQRIAIARAVVCKPPVLILDEATSSLDSESERQVQTAIDSVLKDSTAIIIAHRLSTILHAHKIIVLKRGHIEAIGTHQQLITKSPTYQLLYNLQFRNIKLDLD